MKFSLFFNVISTNI